ARREESARVMQYPTSCEARALLAALQGERKEPAAAHKLVDGLLALARRETPQASDIRCGLHAAAALQDAAAAAALLDRVSGDKTRLRAFAQTIQGHTGTMWIDARVYPWSLIARRPEVAQARDRLDAAYTREREVARATLAGLP